MLYVILSIVTEFLRLISRAYHEPITDQGPGESRALARLGGIMTRLDRQIALVTGASRGIGKGAALELAAAGATVYVTARSVTEGDHPLPGTVGSTVAEIEAAGGKAIAVRCDHTEDEQVEALFERIDKEAGRLDVLVNSAFVDPGIVSGKKFWESPASWYDELNAVGTRGVYIASRLAAQRMVPAGRGLIANVSSLGSQYYYQHVGYGMGKAAVDKLTKDAGREFRKLGVTIVSIWPYMVKTEAVQALLDKGIDLPMEGAESQRFVGRGVVALASDPEATQRNGRIFTSRQLADAYRFTDVDGSLPTGSIEPK
jgi:NAD(P)-dependent dehydrogenase (short-subunit alcohol dehydrogenase family)